MRQQNKRLTPFGRLVSKALIDRDMTRRALAAAMAQAGRLREARQEAREMERRMEEQKLVDRAKAVLAQKEGIGEADAYRRLQRMAMEKRCSLPALAAAVGISPQYLSYILNGTRSGKRYIEAIARVLELDQKQVGKTTAA